MSISPTTVFPSSTAIGAVILSEVRFLRECLAEILARDPSLRIHGACATFAHMLEMVLTVRPEIILLDAAFPEGMATAKGLHAAVPTSQIVVIAITETEENVLAWAEAGVAGYVPNTASLQELTALLRQINRGEQSCSSRISGTLLRRIGSVARPVPPTALQATPLTSRELEILHLIGAGLSNKDIARRLCISVGTTKSHVHSLLGKMKLRRRTEVVARLHSMPRDDDPTGARSQGYGSENHR